jgi:hypothetical protein
MDLTTAIPSFPVQPVLHLSDNRGTTMLPLVDRDLCGEHSVDGKNLALI